MKFLRPGSDDQSTEVEINHIRAGIAWPCEKPGYCCVIGEAAHAEYWGTLAVYKMYLLDESTSYETNDLIEKAINLESKFKIGKCKIEEWYGRGGNDADNSKALRYWNNRCRDAAKDPMFHVRTASHTEKPSILYQLNVLRSCHRPGNELILNWTKETTYGTEIISIRNQTKIEKAQLTCDNYPAVAAVGYVATMFREHPPIRTFAPVRAPQRRSAGGY